MNREIIVNIVTVASVTFDIKSWPLYGDNRKVRNTTEHFVSYIDTR
jgi:hypothetical protein